MSPTTESAVKKPRASKPKVKTGCITCKRRHVKCDEAKPACLKCSNFGRRCEGYPSEDDEPPPKDPTPNSSRRLLSKAVQEMPSRSQTPTTNFAFSNDLEYQYFCVFRDQSAYELAGGFDPSLWTRLVIEACESESIRELTTAVAALGLAKNQNDNSRSPARHLLGSTTPHNDPNKHLQFALIQYGNALKKTRELVANEQDSIRIALIAALLIFVFESLNGDTVRAVPPIQSAIDLILKRLSTMSRPYRGSRTNPNRRQAALPVEEELLSAFLRLDGPSLAIISNKDQQNPPLIRYSPTTFPQTLEIPSGFATINEARLYLEEIKWKVDPNLQSQDGDIYIPRSTLRSWYAAPSNPAGKSLQMQFAQWHHAFTPLFDYSMSAAGDSTFLAASMLHIQALSHGILVSVNEAEQAGATRAIISQARRMLEHESFSRGLVFDVGILPALMSILLRAGDRGVRWEAYEVVRAMVPRREGVFDSRTVADAAERMLREEDEGDFGEMDYVIQEGSQWKGKGVERTREGVELEFMKRFLGAT